MLNENIANNYYKKTEVDTKISESKTSLKAIPLIFANTTFAANAQTEATRAISYANIPAGYTAIIATPMNSGSADLTWNVCNISGGTDVLIRLRNVGATVVAAPRVNLLCIKS